MSFVDRPILDAQVTRSPSIDGEGSEIQDAQPSYTCDPIHDHGPSRTSPSERKSGYSITAKGTPCHIRVVMRADRPIRRTHSPLALIQAM